MEERTKQAFALATELTKQLLTLATGTVAITISFAKDIAPSSARCPRWFLMAGWSLQALSVLAGLFALAALAGTLGNEQGAGQSDPGRKGTPPSPHIYRGNIRFFSGAQFLLFGLGILALVLAAALALWSAPAKP